MSDTPKLSQTPLWPETLRLFRLNQGEWIKWAVVFFIVLIPLDIWVAQGSQDMYKNLLAILGGDKNALQNPPPTPPGHFLDGLLMTVFGFIQLYFYSIIFLRRGSVFSVPKMSVGGLLYFLWVFFLWMLLYLGLMILIMIPAIIVAAVGGAFHVPIALVMTAVVIWAIVAICFLILRYMVVFPLAACRVTSPIKTSSRLMRGNMWRVFVNTFLLWLGMLLFVPANMVLILKSAGLFDSAEAHGSGMAVGILSASLLSLLQIVMSGISAAFNCAICSVLVAEKQATDPSFKLVASSENQAPA